MTCAGRVANGGENDVGPEARAVLADAPGLLLDASARRGKAQQLGGPAAIDVLLGEETREVLTENLFRGIALDTLAARVPGDHVAVAIKKIERVVADAFDDGAQLLVVEAQGFQRGALFRYIAHKAQDHGTEEGVGRLEHDVDRELGAVLAQGEEVHRCAHLAGTRVGGVVFAVAGVVGAESGGHEVVDRQAD